MHKPNIIDGKAIAQNIFENVKRETQELLKSNIIPGLAVIIVGDNPMSKLYVQIKRNRATMVGIKSFVYEFDTNITEHDLIKKIEELNSNPEVHAILIQLPLPVHLNTISIVNKVNPIKDVDGFTLENVGKLVTMQDGLYPCTPQGCLELIKSIEPNLKGKNAVVIGKSNVVGRPMSHILLNEECSVTILHKSSKNIAYFTKKADILVTAAGYPGLITEKHINANMIVIDVGLTKIIKNGKAQILGDVDFENVKDKVKAITPVPGGVGPMTIAYLLKNTIKAAKIIAKY